jgi:AbrB family looped-hinge helix DNA binding protein
LKHNIAHFAEIDLNGNLQIPAEIRSTFGLSPGTTVRIEVNDHEMHIVRPDNLLARVYVEPTNRCNLECVTCIRNVWDEPLGLMLWEVFENILEGIQAFSPLPTIFMGGFGEPLVHPRVVEMVRHVKELGGQVELITNGILLTEKISTQLIAAGLDVLWISIDGVTPASYADVRLGGFLPTVLKNLDNLMRLRSLAYTRKPQVGIAFVAMKRNIHELPDLIRLGIIKGVERFSISNVLAHIAELTNETLYDRTLIEGSYQSAFKFTDINFPRMDSSSQSMAAFQKALQGNYRFQVAGNEVEKTTNQCPFMLKGSTSIRWDGALSPCLPLLHTHESYLGKRLRRSQAYAVGNIMKRDLADLWNDPGYFALRQRLQEFDFPPCTYCNSCEMADSNVDDCYGNVAPTCGGCLWAQGLIQCP